MDLKIYKQKGINNIIKKLLKDVRLGKVGEIDYYFDGKDVIKDKIIFDRKELINWFKRRTDETEK